jgi:hypothetical protein
MKMAFILFIVLTLIGPLWMLLSGRVDLHSDYLTANRSSSHLAPLPEEHPEAIVQVYAARAFNWRAIFALHTWIAIKAKHANHYTVYQVIGWRLFRGLPALSIEDNLPDRLWFNQQPKIIFDLRGEKAEALIDRIDQVVKEYPYANRYVTWPGPNSNTFTAYIARRIPEMKLVLPSNALGKDYIGNHFFARVPSGTGFQISLYGYIGLMIALKEGVEINILGLVYGISPTALKLPGFGDINVKGLIL